MFTIKRRKAAEISAHAFIRGNIGSPGLGQTVISFASGDQTEKQRKSEQSQTPYRVPTCFLLASSGDGLRRLVLAIRRGKAIRNPKAIVLGKRTTLETDMQLEASHDSAKARQSATAQLRKS